MFVTHKHRYGAVIVLAGLLSACQESSEPQADSPAVAPPVAASLPPLSLASTLGCGLPSMPDLHNTCPRRSPQYSDDVVAAIDHVMATRPDLFDRNEANKVADHRGYTNAVVERLRVIGYCAIDQLEEIAVKKTNDFNEQYNIWTSLGYVRKAYISTCLPAQF